jgi:hypothetical protein
MDRDPLAALSALNKTSQTLCEFVERYLKQPTDVTDLEATIPRSSTLDDSSCMDKLQNHTRYLSLVNPNVPSHISNLHNSIMISK